jgi:hypothetical protein
VYGFEKINVLTDNVWFAKTIVFPDYLSDAGFFSKTLLFRSEISVWRNKVRFLQSPCGKIRMRSG